MLMKVGQYGKLEGYNVDNKLGCHIDLIKLDGEVIGAYPRLEGVPPADQPVDLAWEMITNVMGDAEVDRRSVTAAFRQIGRIITRLDERRIKEE